MERFIDVASGHTHCARQTLYPSLLHATLLPAERSVYAEVISYLQLGYKWPQFWADTDHDRMKTNTLNQDKIYSVLPERKLCTCMSMCNRTWLLPFACHPLLAGSQMYYMESKSTSEQALIHGHCSPSISLQGVHALEAIVGLLLYLRKSYIKDILLTKLWSLSVRVVWDGHTQLTSAAIQKGKARQVERERGKGEKRLWDVIVLNLTLPAHLIRYLSLQSSVREQRLILWSQEWNL